MPTVPVPSLVGIAACAWWAAQSVVLVLTSKWVHSAALLGAFPYSILALQSLFTGFTFCALSISIRHDFRPVRLRACSDLSVAVVFFFLYAYSNARALRFISLPAYTVVKSLAPLGVTTVERIAFGKPIAPTVYASLLLALIANYLTFESASGLSHQSYVGYVWALFHLLAHVFYVLSLRYCCADSYITTDKALHVNIIAGTILFIPFAILNREPSHFLAHLRTLTATQRIPLALSVFLGSGCAVSVLYAYEAASSDGLRYMALSNKILIVTLGAWIFRTQFSAVAWSGVSLAVFSGFLFAFALSKTSSQGMPRPIVSSPTLELLLPTRQSDGMDDVKRKTQLIENDELLL